MESQAHLMCILLLLRPLLAAEWGRGPACKPVHYRADLGSGKRWPEGASRQQQMEKRWQPSPAPLSATFGKKKI